MNLKKYSIVLGLFCLVIGSVMHFFYQWSGYNVIVGLFSPVNESPWEHLKLLFYPLLFSMILTILFNKKINKMNIPYTFAIASVIAMAITLTLYFFYTGVFGQNLMIIDLIIYAISVVVSWIYIYFNLGKNHKEHQLYNCILGVLIFILLILLFALWSYYPLEINLFTDPSKN